DLLETVPVLADTVVCHRLQLLRDIRERGHHFCKVMGGHLHYFGVVQRGTTRRTNPAAEQTYFAEVAALREIGQHQLAARIVLSHFHEPDAHQVESICRVALFEDD